MERTGALQREVCSHSSRYSRWTPRLAGVTDLVQPPLGQGHPAECTVTEKPASQVLPSLGLPVARVFREQLSCVLLQALMDSNLPRLQLELYKEIKKVGFYFFLRKKW